MGSAMIKVYARSCERGQKNFYDDIVNSATKSVRDASDAIRAQIEDDGYVINEDGTCSRK